MTIADDTLAGLPHFSDLSKAQLRKIRALMTPIDIAAGRTFITEGANEQEAFIILAGAAEVTRNGEHVATVGPGDIVGEVAIIAGGVRTATVTATEDVTAEVLGRREFLSLLDEDAELMKAILIGAVRHLYTVQPPYSPSEGS